MGHGPRDPPCPRPPAPGGCHRLCTPTGGGLSPAPRWPPSARPGPRQAAALPGWGGWPRGPHRELKKTLGDEGTVPAQRVPAHGQDSKALGAADGPPDQHDIPFQLTQRNSLGLQRPVWAASGGGASPSFPVAYWGSAWISGRIRLGPCPAASELLLTLTRWVAPSADMTSLWVCAVYFLPIGTPHVLGGGGETQQHTGALHRRKGLDHPSWLCAGQERRRSAFSPPETWRRSPFGCASSKSTAQRRPLQARAGPCEELACGGASTGTLLGPAWPGSCLHPWARELHASVQTVSGLPSPSSRLLFCPWSPGSLFLGAANATHCYMADLESAKAAGCLLMAQKAKPCMGASSGGSGPGQTSWLPTVPRRPTQNAQCFFSKAAYVHMQILTAYSRDCPRESDFPRC